MATPESNVIPPENQLTEFPDWVQIREAASASIEGVFDSKDQDRPAQRHKIQFLYLCDRVRPGNSRNYTT
ncbi:hypothetical protein PHMEG_00013713 [Phytophthora megakarya]|uniref:Uncharacterized protein n=1 Tax=Phytophthora megakarya TaxID=4795 RepID=A0A225W5L7_9STRA|nr:hypothetical protein PHMEG_00013713 [Phytophthora megakarya]